MSDASDTLKRELSRCFLCGTLAANTWPPLLQCHEIARGPARKEAREHRGAMILTCQPCHTEHLDAMPIARQLALRQINDPLYSDEDRLLVCRLRGRADNAVTEGEVLAEVYELKAAAEAIGYPYPKHRW